MKINARSLILRPLQFAFSLILLVSGISGTPVLAHTKEEIPKNVTRVLQYMLDSTDPEKNNAIDINRLTPLLNFLQTEKSPDRLYQTDDLLDMSAAFYTFTVNTDLNRMIAYTMDENIPSVLFWPSSIRMSTWKEIKGGKEQLARLRAASAPGDGIFTLKGVEHIKITPDQFSGAYYIYDVNKKIMRFSYQSGQLMIVIARQKGPSDVGLRGWVLGKDEDWTYVYTQDRGLNVTGLGWAKTYMYDSFGVAVYWQKDLNVPEVQCSTVSGVKAGWVKMNMVKPHHIYGGLTRVARAFKYVLENPKLPEPACLSATFSKSRTLSTETLQQYALNYFKTLNQRMSTLDNVPNALKKDFDPPIWVDQMSRNEIISMLALDYLKKILDRNPVMSTHSFWEDTSLASMGN